MPSDQGLKELLGNMNQDYFHVQLEGIFHISQTLEFVNVHAYGLLENKRRNTIKLISLQSNKLEIAMKLGWFPTDKFLSQGGKEMIILKAATAITSYYILKPFREIN